MQIQARLLHLRSCRMLSAMQLDDGALYRIHRSLFQQHCPQFVAQYLQDSSEQIIVLRDVASHDFERFLSMVYPSCVRVSPICSFHLYVSAKLAGATYARWTNGLPSCVLRPGSLSLLFARVLSARLSPQPRLSTRPPSHANSISATPGSYRRLPRSVKQTSG